MYPDPDALDRHYSRSADQDPTFDKKVGNFFQFNTSKMVQFVVDYKHISFDKLAVACSPDMFTYLAWTRYCRLVSRTGSESASNRKSDPGPGPYRHQNGHDPQY